MPLTITSAASGIPASDLPSGAVIQSKRGYNYTTSSKVFSSWNTFEAVPGSLEATITPTAINNKILIAAHICWGGWTISTDVALNFRIFKRIGAGSFESCGTYNTDAGLGIQSTIGVATGCYKYNQGNGDASFDSDNILIYDTATSTSATTYAVYWACGYSPTSRTLYWNRGTGTPEQYAYRPTHTCTITVTEIKA